MFDYDELTEDLNSISELHAELIRRVFDAVHDAEDETDFKQVKSMILELMDGMTASYSALGGLVRFADQREVDVEMKFIVDVRKTINELPLYKEPKKHVGCPSCLAGTRKLTTPCRSCGGSGKIPAVPDAAASGTN